MDTVYRIAGKRVRVAYGDDDASASLRKELALYPRDRGDLVPDLVVEVNGPVPTGVRARNPSIHAIIDDGFVADLGRCTVSWQLRDVLTVTIAYHGKKDWRKKWKDRQYSHPSDRMPQFFHEVLLVPTLLWFFPDIVPVHGSGVWWDGRGGTLFGGTGGVGKTSMLLECAFDPGCFFVADDFTFIGEGGSAFPNLAYPKIYGYNTEGDPELLGRIFEGRGVLDRIQWGYQMRKKGSHRVRRRVAPDTLFGAVCDDGIPLGTVCFLHRRDVVEVGAREIDADTLADLNWNIVRTEYAQLFNHVHWYEMNAKLIGVRPVVSLAQIEEDYRRGFRKGTETARKLVLSIPLGLKRLRFGDVSPLLALSSPTS